MTLDNLISQLKDVQAANGNIEVQLLELYCAGHKVNKNSIFTNEVHLSYALEEEEEPTEETPPDNRIPIGFC